MNGHIVVEPRPDELVTSYHSVRSWLTNWIDRLTVIGATCGVASIGGQLSTLHQSVNQTLPDIVAVLVLFLLSPRRPFIHTQFRREVIQQLYSTSPALIVAGLIQASLFWWLGWSEFAIWRTTSLWLVTVSAATITAHGFLFCVLHHPTIKQRLTSKIAIIGYDVHAAKVADLLYNNTSHSIKVSGLFYDRVSPNDPFPLNGSLDDLIRLNQNTRFDAIIIALPPDLGHVNQIPSITSRLRSVPADVFVMPYLIHDPDLLLPLQVIGSLPLMVLQRRPLDQRQAIQKKAFDIVISLVAFFPFLIIFLIVAAAIKLDSPGPVLFRQPRNGLNNQPFTIFKFRSMYTHASDLKSIRQTSRGDPRVTRVGKWLRKLSIDEFPQLLNVLRGEMSLVGPRPHAPGMRIEGKPLDDVVMDYVVRLKVKPGITGWAQINGARGELVESDDLRRRVAYDLEYIQRWSIGFDLKIIALTVIREIISKHAF